MLLDSGETQSRFKPKPRPRSFRNTAATSATTEDVVIEKEKEDFKAYKETHHVDTVTNVPVTITQEKSLNRAYKEQDYFDTYTNFKSEIANKIYASKSIGEKINLDPTLYSKPSSGVRIEKEFSVVRGYKETFERDATAPLQVPTIEHGNLLKGLREKVHIENAYSKPLKEIVIIKELEVKPSLVALKKTPELQEDPSVKYNYKECETKPFSYPYTPSTHIDEFPLEESVTVEVDPDLELNSDSYYRYFKYTCKGS